MAKLKNMGWNVTIHEGKICYDRDGMRVYRTQDIEAIERQERIEAEQRNNSVRWDCHEEEWESPESDLTTTQTLIIFGMLIAAILYLIFGAG